jgi:fatty-acyl-CoA synthase
MDAIADVRDRGFTFVDHRGAERFLPFCDLVAEVRRTAANLLTFGFMRGDRIALVIPEHEPFVVTFLATMVAGLAPVPIYPPSSLRKLDGWKATTTHILRVSGAAAIVTSDDLRPSLSVLMEGSDALLLTSKLLAAQNKGLLAFDVRPDDLAFLQFTSGSTAAPRGVMVSHRNIVENCTGIVQEFLQSATDNKGVSWLPLYHDMGLIGFVLSPILAARPVILLSTIGFIKRPSLWLELIHRHRATITSAPNFAYALASRRIAPEQIAQWDLSCLRVACCGGEPISTETLQTFSQKLGAAGFSSSSLRPCYGMAEATLVITYSRTGEMWISERIDAEHFGSQGEARPARAGARYLEFVGCGAPLAEHSVRILNEGGERLPDRVVGEIEFSGPSLTSGYFNDAAATAECYRDGAVLTADLGYLADGHLFVTGRKKDLIIVRGTKFVPQGIEWCVESLSGLRKGGVIAFGYPNEAGTEDIVIACESANGDDTKIARSVRSCVYENYALSLADVVVLPPGALPKTSSGKLQRSLARTLYLEGSLQKMATTREVSGLTSSSDG